MQGCEEAAKREGIVLHSFRHSPHAAAAGGVEGKMLSPVTGWLALPASGGGRCPDPLLHGLHSRQAVANQWSADHRWSVRSTRLATSVHDSKPETSLPASSSSSIISQWGWGIGW